MAASEKQVQYHGELNTPIWGSIVVFLNSGVLGSVESCQDWIAVRCRTAGNRMSFEAYP